MQGALELLENFLQKHQEDPTSNDNVMLEQAAEHVDIEMRESSFSIESVRMAHKIYGLLGDQGLNRIVEVMKCYLVSRKDDPLENQFWARWELVDNLALLKRYKEMIKEQRSFLDWTMENMSHDYWLKVIYDSTQGVGWVEEGLQDEWFSMYEEVMNKVKRTEENRLERILLVETAAGLYIFNLLEAENALKEIARYDEILQEDPSWSRYNEFSTRIRSYQLEVYRVLKDWEKYDAIALKSLAELEQQIKLYQTADKEGNVLELSSKAHELGTCFMWANRYQDALKLYRFAVENTGSGVNHFFYAVCLWAQEKDKEKTLHHLRMAEHDVTWNGGLRGRYKQMFLNQPEFADVYDDQEFLTVFHK
ncbi:hypothetical protein [Bacillus niameyensis]|uniref:hypothetical protein n=1 Tax=Bacillus niameyensis TaxID=1522308 RepID=UPI000785E0DF|nr:hypothetical protein [Bacillus niameyensis]